MQGEEERGVVLEGEGLPFEMPNAVTELDYRSIFNRLIATIAARVFVFVVYESRVVVKCFHTQEDIDKKDTKERKGCIKQGKPEWGTGDSSTWWKKEKEGTVEGCLFFFFFCACVETKKGYRRFYCYERAQLGKTVSGNGKGSSPTQLNPTQPNPTIPDSLFRLRTRPKIPPVHPIYK